jgi:hypothetical protein
MRSRCQLHQFEGVQGITLELPHMTVHKAGEALLEQIRELNCDATKHRAEELMGSPG